MRPARDWGKLTIMGSGLFLIILGAILICAQLLGMVADQIQGNGQGVNQFQQQMSASRNGVSTTTHFVGFELVLVGAVLQIVGFVGNAAAVKSKSLPRTGG